MMTQYTHVLKSNGDEDPFEDTSKFISDDNTEAWEQFLNGGYTREEPKAPGIYLVLWKPRKDGKAAPQTDIAVACQAKNNKKRFIWEDPHLRKFIMSRSTFPLPHFLTG